MGRGRLKSCARDSPLSPPLPGAGEPVRLPMENGRKSFDWIHADRRHLRGDLKRIAAAIRAGQFDGPNEAWRRRALSAALSRLDLDKLNDREVLRLVDVVLAACSR
jgi:hypothetical protein